MNYPRLTLGTMLCAFAFFGFGAASVNGADENPGNAKAASKGTDSPSAALKKFQVAPGLKVDLYASEPTVQNPVSIAFDEEGRLFVVESFRRRSSVFDIRNHTEWLDNDLSFRTVEDRIDFLKKSVTSEDKAFMGRIAKTKKGGLIDFNKDGKLDWKDLEVETERITRLFDSNGDGVADKFSVFANGFNTLVSGVAAGILAHKGNVYFTCIPDVWLLRDADGTGKAQTRKVIETGFGTHIAFGGHDMHGLIFGPDGKLYWSIADRGTSTNLWSKIKSPPPGLTPELLADSGCVFRSNPDGSDFEVVAWGLRNPQELAFDDFGNLFTADNNGDGGDKARWHYVVEGADFGWRIGWQWLPKMGPWNSERLWHLANSNTASYSIPPLAHIGHGPAGLAYYPGSGLPNEYSGHFFLCDFPGYVLTWTNRPVGASFEVGPVQNFFGDLGPSDCAFAPGGGLYVSDWTKTFERTGKGRIYKVHSPEADKNPLTIETQRLLREGMQNRSVKELATLLGHGDMRIRTEARQEMVERSNRATAQEDIALKVLSEIALTGKDLVARVNAIEGLSQMLRLRSGNQQEGAAFETILTQLSTDPEAEIRAQAVCASAAFQGSPALVEKCRRLLSDRHARVQFHAAMAAAKRRDSAVTPALLQLLKDSNDAYVRHAAIYALACSADTEGLVAAGKDSSRSVRMGALLALRRRGSSGVGMFLQDSDPQIVLEAARAINDTPMPELMPQLAKVISRKSSSETERFTARRAMNANFRLGTAEGARALAEFATRQEAPESLRVEALEMLGDWKQPKGRDKIMGLWRPLPARDGAMATAALRPLISSLTKDASETVRLATLRTAALLDCDVDYLGVVSNGAESTPVRVEALKALAQRKDARLTDGIQVALASKDAPLRVEATRLQSEGGGDSLAAVLQKGSVTEKQAVLATIGKETGAKVAQALLPLVRDLVAGTLAPELRFDVLEASRKRPEPAIKEQIAKYEANRPRNNPLAPYMELLYGGNAEEGKKTFIERQDVACFRCHKVNGEGGEVGPDLTGIGKRQSRDYILESIVFPNRQIAAGFESVIVTLKNGTAYAGLLKKETDSELEIHSPEDGIIKVKKEEVKSRDRGLSAMPEELANILSKQDIRNLVEFLSLAK